MTERSNDDTARPLPRHWLPDPHPSAEDPKWETSIERIMTVADPELRMLKWRRSAAEGTWWSGMERWWKPAAVMAAASTALVLFVGRPALVPEPPSGSIPLGLVASAGDPATLWEALGVEADPVLALIAVGEQWDAMGQSATPAVRQEENR